MTLTTPSTPPADSVAGALNHHPDDATLVSYAAAGLPDAFAVLVSCHLQRCSRCRQRVEDAEQLGGLLLATAKPAPGDKRQQFLALLDAQMAEESAGPLGAADLLGITADTVPGDDISARRVALPPALQQLLDHGDIDLPWRRLVPGIQQIRLDSRDGTLRLLKIAPGISIPLHTHKGSELTLILHGSYSDELGRFKPGDMADLDGDVDHQPITDGNDPCICLIATDAPLRFRGLLPKLLQPFTGL